jgi:hypothetical protein
VGFKVDAINKIKKVIREIYKDYPYLYFYSQDNALEYFKGIVPILHEKLDSYELSVLVEILSLEISSTYNEQFYAMKKIYDAIIIFRVDPQIVIGELLNEAKGFSGIGG